MLGILMLVPLIIVNEVVLMKNENDYFNSNPGLFQDDGESQRASTESILNAGGLIQEIIEASALDDTGWDEAVIDSVNLEEETY